MHHPDFLLLTDALNASDNLPVSKVVAGDPKTQGIKLFLFPLSKYLSAFVSSTRLSRWTQYVSLPTSVDSILDLILTTGLMQMPMFMADKQPNVIVLDCL